MPNMGIYSLKSGFYLSLFSILAIPATIAYQGQIASANPDWRGQLAQTPPVSPDPQSEDMSEPDDTRSLVLSDSILSLQGAEKLMNEAKEAINSEKYDIAAANLLQARKIFNQLSNFHIQLANSFSGIDQTIYEAQRNSALKTGQLRDEATYRLALVHRAQNKPELAVPLLIQIIRSQNPASELGKKSYQQLYEIGFVSAPYSGSATPPASSPATSPKTRN